MVGCGWGGVGAGKGVSWCERSKPTFTYKTIRSKYSTKRDIIGDFPILVFSQIRGFTLHRALVEPMC